MSAKKLLQSHGLEVGHLAKRRSGLAEVLDVQGAVEDHSGEGLVHKELVDQLQETVQVRKIRLMNQGQKTSWVERRDLDRDDSGSGHTLAQVRCEVKDSSSEEETSSLLRA